MTKKYLLLLFIMVLFFTDHSVSQTIFGKVVSSENNTPIYGVDVFLVNTNAGCATDKEGRYKIENISPGNYFLAFHHIGYENKYFQIKLYEGDEKEFLVSLETKIIEGEEVRITAKKINWEKYFEIFKCCFIGMTSNANECFLRNPMVLNFKISEDKLTLTASADEMLKIDNYSLGYHLDAILEKFEYSFIDQRKKYLILPRFKEMKYQEMETLKIWEKNRKQTYKGSLEHFLSTLITEATVKEGFKVFQGSSVSTSLYTYDITDFHLTIVDSLLNMYNIIIDSHLDVKYPYFAKNAHISGIEANVSNIVFFQNGFLLNPLSLIVFGKWAEYGVADMLPMNYYFH